MSTFHGLGAAFFPEHHSRDTWRDYVRLMREIPLSFVRMGEFAWDKLEPAQGRFDFAWLDEVFALLAEASVDVLLCTPTAVPPIWAVEKYPEICPVHPDGKTFGWGIRRYTCPTSAPYRDLSAAITGALADHYGPSPQVMGWQLDNEIGHPYCYCPRCRRFFQDWCEDHFHTVEHFNDAHGMHFLGQTVQGWHQIPFPNTYPSPSLWMTYHRFFSEMTVDCFALQARVLREHGVTAPITTNLMVTWGGYDHQDLAEHLDLMAVDAYTLGDIFGQDFEEEAWTAAYTRGLKPSRNIWYNEMQWAGSGGGFPLPGQTRWWTLLRAGLGADALNYFRWDTAPSGLERDILGLLKPSRQPGRIFAEVHGVAQELAALQPLLDGTTPAPAPVAVLYTYDNHWEFAEQRKLEEFSGPGGNGYALHLAKHFRAVAGTDVPVDVVYPRSDFSQYRLIIAPALYSLSAELGAKLDAYVRAGGTLLLTCFSGLVDENALMHDTPAPGPPARDLRPARPRLRQVPPRYRRPARRDRRPGAYVREQMGRGDPPRRRHGGPRPLRRGSLRRRPRPHPAPARLGPGLVPRCPAQRRAVLHLLCVAAGPVADRAHPRPPSRRPRRRPHQNQAPPSTSSPTTPTRPARSRSPPPT